MLYYGFCSLCISLDPPGTCLTGNHDWLPCVRMSLNVCVLVDSSQRSERIFIYTHTHSITSTKQREMLAF